jgi:hypothetical protein
MSDLKPCPFCGGEPKYTSDEDAYSYTVYGRGWFEVGCDNCGFELQDKKVWDDEMRLTKECYEKDSFDRWNTRPQLDGDREAAKEPFNKFHADLVADYDLAKMPNGDFVGEVYYLTHDVITALKCDEIDKNAVNDAFIRAETLMREYVWKACLRALQQQSVDVGEPVAFQVYNPLVKDWTMTYQADSQGKAGALAEQGYKTRPLYAVQPRPPLEKVEGLGEALEVADIDVRECGGIAFSNAANAAKKAFKDKYGKHFQWSLKEAAHKYHQLTEGK